MSTNTRHLVTGDSELDTVYPVSDEQVTNMHERSWALLPALLNADVIDGIRSTLATTEFREPRYRPGTKSKPTGKDVNIHEAVAWRSSFLLSVATSRRLSSAALRLMKLSDAVFVDDMSFFKPPGGSEIPFHQDYSSLPYDRQGGVAFWIALIDLPEESGPLRYLEGSHREGPLGFRDPVDIRDVYPQLRERKVGAGRALRAGDCQVHWDLTVHGSA